MASSTTPFPPVAPESYHRWRRERDRGVVIPRRLAQRWKAADLRDGQVEEALTSPNSLLDTRAGRDLSLRPLGRKSQIDPARASVLRRVRRRVAAYGPCPTGLTPLGAHQELLKTSDVYCEDGRSLREPYDADRADRVKLLSGDIEPKEAASFESRPTTCATPWTPWTTRRSRSRGRVHHSTTGRTCGPAGTRSSTPAWRRTEVDSSTP